MQIGYPQLPSKAEVAAVFFSNKMRQLLFFASGYVCSSFSLFPHTKRDFLPSERYRQRKGCKKRRNLVDLFLSRRVFLKAKKEWKSRTEGRKTGFSYCFQWRWTKGVMIRKQELVGSHSVIWSGGRKSGCGQLMNVHSDFFPAWQKCGFWKEAFCRRGYILTAHSGWLCTTKGGKRIALPGLAIPKLQPTPRGFFAHNCESVTPDGRAEQ